MAIYEEYGGTLWRHGTVSRRATNLAIKYYTTIENYDYGFTWRFKQDGTIDVDIELTGIVEIQAVNRTNKVYDGLPQWGARNRPISNNDVVIWYVAGITHVVRPEEWPVMPAHHMGFSLMPFGFFSGNPTMAVPMR